MSLKTVRKKPRSFVRFLASWIPSFLWKYLLPLSPRMYISASFIQKKSDLHPSSFSPDDSNTSFCTFKQNFHNKNQEFIFNSTPKRLKNVEDVKLKVLQEELNEIKKIVARLMERQSEQCSGYETFSNPDQIQKSFIEPPPPPPPPPLPPLGSNSLVLLPNSSKKIEKKKTVIPQHGFLNGKDLLKELKKVQLKKIEKSPGGGPIKKPKAVNDPGDFLAAVLKKRFGCVQNSPDSSHESVSVDADNSFGSETISNNYGIERNNKITVS